MSLYRPLTLVAALALLAGCATIPKPLEGTYTDVSTASAQQGGAGGTRVRWGGEIIKTEPGPQQTCFYLLSRRWTARRARKPATPARTRAASSPAATASTIRKCSCAAAS